jgi:DNA-binding CsgD family transcriptional regulator
MIVAISAVHISIIVFQVYHHLKVNKDGYLKFAVLTGLFLLCNISVLTNLEEMFFLIGINILLASHYFYVAFFNFWDNKNSRFTIWLFFIGVVLTSFLFFVVYESIKFDLSILVKFTSLIMVFYFLISLLFSITNSISGNKNIIEFSFRGMLLLAFVFISVLMLSLNFNYSDLVALNLLMILSFLDFLLMRFFPKTGLVELNNGDLINEVEELTHEEIHKLFDLTEPQIEVVDLIIQGMHTQDIAKKLNISDRAVYRRKEHILSKTKANSDAQIILLYFSKQARTTD